MQELNQKPSDHVVVTAPDRYFQDSIKILLIDWPPDLVDQALRSLERSTVPIAFHIFDFNDSDFKWLIDVANQADVVAMDISNINHIDIIKGYIIARPNAFYFGRLGMNKIFSNYTDDPIGQLLIKVGDKISQMEE